jgi:hypothetical protein
MARERRRSSTSYARETRWCTWSARRSTVRALGEAALATSALITMRAGASGPGAIALVEVEGIRGPRFGRGALISPS